jgi:hypothetical protein
MSAKRRTFGNRPEHVSAENDAEYENWFTAQVKKGIAQADRGELVDQEDVVARACKAARGNRDEPTHDKSKPNAAD